MELLITNEDGSTTKFTEDMAVTAIKERDQLRADLKSLQERHDKSWTKITNIRQEVYHFFNNQYNPSDEELTFSISDVNSLLEDIGADKLKRTYTVRGTIDFVISDIEATDEDDARDMVENNIVVEFDGNSVDDWSLDIRHTEEN